MKTCGITAEYNPFHNGHKYQIEQTRQQTNCDAIIAVMSGNFTQRGEPATVNKWLRAETAIQNGVDLVLELPVFYAIQGATRFAHGSVSILKQAGCHWISFGSECGNLPNLQEIAETSVNTDHLREYMASGMSYPKAYSLLTYTMAPNDILAVSYLKEIQGTNIEPILIPRTNAYLSEDLQEIASAKAIRKAVLEEKDVSIATPMADILKTEPHQTIANLYPYLRTQLLLSSRASLQNIFLVNEGIEKLMQRAAETEATWQGFLNACTSYRYTASRIQRTALMMMLQITKQDAAELEKDLTIRVLAMNETGRQYLHELKSKDIRYSSRFAQLSGPRKALEYKAAELYTSTLCEEKRKDILQLEIQGAHYLP